MGISKIRITTEESLLLRLWVVMYLYLSWRVYFSYNLSVCVCKINLGYHISVQDTLTFIIIIHCANVDKLDFGKMLVVQILLVTGNHGWLSSSMTAILHF